MTSKPGSVRALRLFPLSDHHVIIEPPVFPVFEEVSCSISPGEDSINVRRNSSPVPDVSWIPIVRKPVVVIISPVLISREQISFLVLPPNKDCIKPGDVGPDTKVCDGSRS